MKKKNMNTFLTVYNSNYNLCKIVMLFLLLILFSNFIFLGTFCQDSENISHLNNLDINSIIKIKKNIYSALEINVELKKKILSSGSDSLGLLKQIVSNQYKYMADLNSLNVSSRVPANVAADCLKVCLNDINSTKSIIDDLTPVIRSANMAKPEILFDFEVTKNLNVQMLDAEIFKPKS